MADSGSPDERDKPQRARSARPETILIGLGNPILGDDAVGWRVVQEVQSRLDKSSAILELSPAAPGLEIDTLSLGGLSLMECLVGYKQALLVDAVETGEHPVGYILEFPLGSLPENLTSHLPSAHDTSLQDAIKMGRSLGIPLPENIRIIGIEVQTSYDFSDSLSDEVQAIVPQAADLVLDRLRRMADNNSGV